MFRNLIEYIAKAFRTGSQDSQAIANKLTYLLAQASCNYKFSLLVKMDGREIVQECYKVVWLLELVIEKKERRKTDLATAENWNLALKYSP